MAIRVPLNDAEEGQQFALIKEVEELNAGDRRAVRGAVPLTMANGGLVYPGDYDDQMRNALLARIITEWNLAHPLPKGDTSVFDKLSIDQLDRLYEAVEPHRKFLDESAINPAARGTDPT